MLTSEQVRGHFTPTQPPPTLTPIKEYSKQPTDEYPASTAYLAQPGMMEAAGSRFQEQVSADVATLAGGAAWSRGRNSRNRGESENVLARRQTPLASGRDYQSKSHESFQRESAGGTYTRFVIPPDAA